MNNTELTSNIDQDIFQWDYGIKELIRKLLQQNPIISRVVGDNIFFNQTAKSEDYISIEINSLKEMPPNKAKADITISIFINNTNQKLDQLDDIVINEIKKIFFNEINFQEKNSNKNILMFQKTIKQNKNYSSINYDAFIKLF